MSEDHETNRIRAHAQNLLRGGTMGNALVATSGCIETPVAVQMLDGRLQSWFVPVTVGDHLVGFFQFLPDGTFMRFSSFQRRANELTGCPTAADWLDLDRIQVRAEVQRQPDEISNKPFLTYDRTPDRLVWAVPLTDASGDVRFVYVVGETVYLPPSEETYS
jgi:hypothetical protein